MKIRINFKRFTIFLLILFTFYIFSMHYKAIVDGINIDEEKEKYEQLIAEQTTLNNALNEKKESVETDEYYEDLARDNLGLIKSTETLYVNADAK